MKEKYSCFVQNWVSWIFHRFFFNAQRARFCALKNLYFFSEAGIFFSEEKRRRRRKLCALKKRWNLQPGRFRQQGWEIPPSPHTHTRSLLRVTDYQRFSDFFFFLGGGEELPFLVICELWFPPSGGDWWSKSDDRGLWEGIVFERIVHS